MSQPACCTYTASSPDAVQTLTINGSTVISATNCQQYVDMTSVVIQATVIIGVPVAQHITALSKFLSITIRTAILQTPTKQYIPT